jgi:hypothetical protein
MLEIHPFVALTAQNFSLATEIEGAPWREVLTISRSSL